MYKEAAKHEKQTLARLREAKKLSLIVDLDQTIIHATHDKTAEEILKAGGDPAKVLHWTNNFYEY